MLSGGWDWNRIPFELTPEIKSTIQAILISLADGGRDRIGWRGNARGCFDLKSAYSFAREVDDVEIIDAGWIWKLETLPKIKTFLWRCVHNSIGVKDCLARRGFMDDKGCFMCHRDPETILHALRDCLRVKHIWSQLGVKGDSSVFWRSNLHNWLQNNGKGSFSPIQGKPPWRIMFNFAVWRSIWKSRNSCVFNRKSPNPNLHKEIYNQATEFMFCVASPHNQVRKISKRIRWEKPPAGWKKLNTDRSVLRSMERAGCGGVVRDEHGSWVTKFTRHVGATNSFAAEFWGLRDGLILCSSLNISCLTIEIDAKVIVDVLQNSDYVNHIVSPILDNCRNLMTRFQQVQVKHCYRHANHCADLMA